MSRRPDRVGLWTTRTTSSGRFDRRRAGREMARNLDPRPFWLRWLQGPRL